MATDDVVLSVGALLARATPRAGADPDITTMGRRYSGVLDRTVERWQAEVSPLQLATLIRQVEAAVHAVHPDGLAHLHTEDHGGAVLLAEAMRETAALGVAAVIAEADRAGLQLEPPPPAAALSLADWARAAADVLAAGLALTAGREALRLWRPGIAAADVADGVRAYVGSLTDRGLRDTIGGALTRAQNLGRMAAYRAPRPPEWSVALVADETLDTNTCKPCRNIDGTTLPTPEAAALAYGGAGYLFCEGRERCRGTMRGVWTREDTPEEREHAALMAGLQALDHGAV